MTPRRAPEQWDIAVLCGMLHDHWVEVFRSAYLETKFGNEFPKATFTVIKSFRNAWAHQAILHLRDAYRILDLMTWVLDVARVPCVELHSMRLEVLRYLSIESFQGQMDLC